MSHYVSQVSASQRIQITFTHFDLEDGGQQSDFVTLHLACDQPMLYVRAHPCYDFRTCVCPSILVCYHVCVVGHLNTLWFGVVRFKFSGNVLPHGGLPLILPSATNVCVKFHSDVDVQRSGFRAEIGLTEPCAVSCPTPNQPGSCA